MEHLPFSLFANPMQERVAELFKKATVVLKLNIPKDVIKSTYLDSYPSEYNQIFRERAHYDGVFDINFVRTLGSCIFVMADNTYTSVWDLKVDGYFQKVADNMHSFVMNNIKSDTFLFSYPEPTVGHKPNVDSKNSDIRWTHFYATIPSYYKTVDSTLFNKISPTKRGLTTYTVDILDTVLDLIESNSLYRGTEFKTTLEKFKTLLIQYNSLTSESDKLVFIFNSVKQKGNISTIRSTVIGTLLDDLAEGKDLEDAVKSFENKIAPQNYQRPKAIITSKMISLAQEKIKELGFEQSLQRRFANETDLDIKDVLFTHRSAVPLNVFDDLIEESTSTFKEQDIKNSAKISLEDFIKTIVPKASIVELLVDTKHTSNFVSLLTSENKDSPSLFKWDNNFSWSYNGGVTDSLREQVKKFGGSVEGDVRFSLAWFNKDDLDLHLYEPKGSHISYSNRRQKSAFGGMLDLDMNGLDKHSDSEPVENIIYKDIKTMPDGDYKLVVDLYSRRTTADQGFILEVEVLGETVQYNSTVSKDFTIHFNKFGNTITPFTIPSELTQRNGISKEIWGIKTNTWTKVNTITLSPNFWNNNKVGNKHLFMFIDKCINPDDSNGFYNEFLCNELKENRKVLNVLGSKMKAKSVSDQLSGLGFSSTIKNNFYVRVTNQNNSKKVFKVDINGIDL